MNSEKIDYSNTFYNLETGEKYVSARKVLDTYYDMHSKDPICGGRIRKWLEPYEEHVLKEVDITSYVAPVTLAVENVRMYVGRDRMVTPTPKYDPKVLGVVYTLTPTFSDEQLLWMKRHDPKMSLWDVVSNHFVITGMSVDHGQALEKKVNGK